MSTDDMFQHSVDDALSLYHTMQEHLSVYKRLLPLVPPHALPFICSQTPRAWIADARFSITHKDSIPTACWQFAFIPSFDEGYGHEAHRIRVLQSAEAIADRLSGRYTSFEQFENTIWLMKDRMKDRMKNC